MQEITSVQCIRGLIATIGGVMLISGASAAEVDWS